MNEIKVFKEFGLRIGSKVYATRKQIEILYNVPKATLADNIDKLREDGLINGTKIRSVANDGKQRLQEVFTLEESIAIGMRLSSDTAILLQRYAAELIVQKVRGLEEQKRLLEIELSYAWNQSDTNDLYR